MGIDAWSAGVALLVLVALVWCIAAIRERNAAMVALASVAVILGSFYFVYRTLVTPSGSWPIMYAAVNERTGAERRERIAELMPLWHYGQVRRVDWYLLSHRWDVCHRMWEQRECRMPPGPLEAEGFVRDDIHALAKEVR